MGPTVLKGFAVASKGNVRPDTKENERSNKKKKEYHFCSVSLSDSKAINPTFVAHRK